MRPPVRRAAGVAVAAALVGGAVVLRCRTGAPPAVAAAIRLSVAGLARFAAHADTIATQPALRRVLLATQVAHPDRVAPAALAADIRASVDAPVVGPLLRVLPQQRLDALPADRRYPVRVVWAAGPSPTGSSRSPGSASRCSTWCRARN